LFAQAGRPALRKNLIGAAPPNIDVRTTASLQMRCGYGANLCR
jgi:hypothetical protein